MKIRVLSSSGRFIPGYGSRGQGEAFDLPDDVARDYLEQYPADYERIEPVRVKKRAEAKSEEASE